MNKEYLIEFALLAVRYGIRALQDALDEFPPDKLPTIEEVENAILG